MLCSFSFRTIASSISLRGLNLRSLYSCFPFIFVALGSSYFIIRNNQLKRVVLSLFRQIHYDRCSPKLINNVDDCIAAVNELRKNCNYIRVLGMDCEWLSDGNAMTKVALLQLASIDGSCSLFRLCNIGHVPQCLSELLMDKSILKTGVAVTSDARRLLKDYGVSCNGCIDVRYMAKHVGLTALGLAKMSELYLGIELDKNWRIRCSDWEAEVLSDKQIQYAANDAIISVFLFKYFNDTYMNKTYPWWKRLFWSNKYYWNKTNDCWNRYSDLGFSEKSFSWHQQKGKSDKDGSGSCNVSDFDSMRKKISSTSSKDNFRQFSTRTDIARKSPFYHNIFVQAPDGMVLCTCDNKKVDWYLKKGIAHVVCEDPLTIRLNFEPAGRKGGGEGYYAKVKKNICVVCGSIKSMRRKSIVPHEYRKYFPVELKEHSSHDVLLLCDYCHFRSQFFDQQLRSVLAEQCNAPYGVEGNSKVVELPEMKQIKSAARALLFNKERIPESRKNELESLLCNYLKDNRVYEYISKYIPSDEINDFKNSEILSDGLLEKLSEIETSIENENYLPHGLKVVEYYNERFTGGVYDLEQLWRKHFIENMVPKYLPDLWSIDYKHTIPNSSDR